ncbi:MAG: glycosyltransferase family 4 protein [Anaerolineales bacterium]|nr:glycosyltransferase family 4 protein [Anaerolineales bacterium]MCK5633461.1 glycosyltransferase family 4 protein [Anaerolineales bacterium]
MNNRESQYAHMVNIIADSSPSNWEDITCILADIRTSARMPPPRAKDELLHMIAAGTAFLTFDYGIDGVSIEIAKYALALEYLYSSQTECAIHFIGGDFYPQADSVLKPDWRRHKIAGINGWSKWDGGKWFSALFYQDMNEGSPQSDQLAVEIYRQAGVIANKLGGYLVDNNISMLIPVNIASNPGNLALTLAIAFITETMDIKIINSNHDFYWDGGKPASERRPGEEPGIRDHFFRNVQNKSFFTLLKSLYPWNGQNWLQVNINKLQSEMLITEFGFPASKVFELSTSLSDEFFEEYTKQEVKSARLRMGYILSDGEASVHPVPVESHIDNLSNWMANQKPCMLGARAGLSFDPTSENLIYLLQPTRVVARKRIQRELHLLGALMDYPPFRNAFEQNTALQLVLHITGPTPIEHQVDLEAVLQAYIDVLRSVPVSISDRLFLAFSVGNEDHPSFRSNNFNRLSIEEIYRMASAVVFPSETEGRGLPILEACASGVPLICSRYNPHAVFADVIGESLPENQQIRYTLFPESDFPPPFLEEATAILLHPENYLERTRHNREAVHVRFSTTAFRERFIKLIDDLS